MSEEYPDKCFDVIIRRAVLNDIQTIVTLINQGALEGTKSIPYTAPITEGYYQAFQKIDKDANQCLMVAEIQDEVVGTFQLSFLTYLQGCGQKDCQIESVFIASKWRGQGIGTTMIN